MEPPVEFGAPELGIAAHLPPAQNLAGLHAQLGALLEYGADFLVVLDADTHIVYASQACLRTLGLLFEEVVGRSAVEGLHPDDVDQVRAELQWVLDHPGVVHSYGCRAAHRSGEWRHLEMATINQLDDPLVGRILSIGRDVTEREENAIRLSHQATHDALTGLPNRQQLLKYLDRALVLSQRTGRAFAVLFLDLDHFKRVNDSLGHQAGDGLLVAIAERIRSVARAGDRVARISGDEFVILAEDLIGPAEAVGLGERIREAILDPLDVEDWHLSLSCSIGVAVSSRTGGAETLLQEADTAMYRAKAQGRNRVVPYDRRMRSEAQRRLDAEVGLRAALREGRIVAAHQPIVNLITGEVDGTEALARIRQPDGTLIGPVDFIDVAEESGLVVPLGEAMLIRACAQQARWLQAAEGGSQRVSVNISARQLLSPDLTARVSAALDGAGLEPERLILELTESTFIDAGWATLNTLTNLRSLGVTFAIDDFGTGWSSLTTLRRFPVDAIKIDRSFVSGLGLSDGDTQVVKAVIDLGHALGKQVVAEGVENATQLAVLRELGCEMAQGYFFGRPEVPPPFG
ncbi:MAG: putative bifunctional diguanylate cyclase/phosphodiesterase [Acidimicrobiales bacterium]